MNQRQRVRNCPIDVYVASNMTYDYPYKLVKPEHVSTGVVNSADTVIMDSGIGDDTTNKEVLDLAEKYDVDFVVAKDYLHLLDETTESIQQFLDLHADHTCRATPMIPLQPPHHQHYTELEGQYHYLLGGMAFDYSTEQIIDAVEKFVQVAGTSPYVHLLGVGANPKLMDYLARNPEYVQSIDCSTPEQCAINGNIYGTELRQEDYNIRTGEGSSSTRAGLAQHLAYTLCDSIRERHEQQDQQQLTAFQ